MDSREIRKKFLEFFKARGHAVVPSSSLVPDDPSVLLTTAGMQQFKKYYTGEGDAKSDFGSLSTASVQKCFRTSDIDEVGDDTHLTFFEMLGNFSFGGYFKKEAISYAHEFIVKEMGLEISYVTVFKGSAVVPRDEESVKIWHTLGVPDVREEGMEDVFWGPTGTSGPCGPTTEVYCKNAAGEDVEIWNIVFNQYFFPGSREELLMGASGKELQPLATPGVDTGMGFERLVMVSQEKSTVFETDLFAPLLALLPAELDARKKRIIADHARGAAFLIGDGVRPSNKGAGYVLRRLMRRVYVYEKTGGISAEAFNRAAEDVIRRYAAFYPELHAEAEVIIREINAERERFAKTLLLGIKELDKIKGNESGEELADKLFRIYESQGVYPDMSLEILKGRGLGFDNYVVEGFQNTVRVRRVEHQEISRAGREKKFGGHGLILDTGELKAADEKELQKVTRLHTATHMLHQALREVLGPEVRQAGSDITAERTRFDFTFPRKLTPEEIKQVEALVNEKVKEDLPMQKVVLPKAEAEKTGALFFFKEKYPDPVNVYFIGRDLETAWSKEFCGGPHVTHTGEIGAFRVLKDEAVGAGVRRIRAAVTP